MPTQDIWNRMRNKNDDFVVYIAGQMLPVATGGRPGGALDVFRRFFKDNGVRESCDGNLEGAADGLLSALPDKESTLNNVATKMIQVEQLGSGKGGGWLSLWERCCYQQDKGELKELCVLHTLNGLTKTGFGPLQALLWSLKHGVGQQDAVKDSESDTTKLLTALRSRPKDNLERLRDQLCMWCHQSCGPNWIGLPICTASNTMGGRPTIDFKSLLADNSITL